MKDLDMTTKMSKLALAISALMMAGGAMAQSTASATGTANATVFAPIAITAVATLEFGKVLSRAYTVTIAPDGTRADSVASTNTKGTFRNATFAVTGEPNHIYTITLPGSIQLDTTSTGTTVTTMTANAFTVGAGTNGTLSGVVGTLSATGTADLNVGAMLTVNNNQAAGSYAKTYTVTVAYN